VLNETKQKNLSNNLTKTKAALFDWILVVLAALTVALIIDML